MRQLREWKEKTAPRLVNSSLIESGGKKGKRGERDFPRPKKERRKLLSGGGKKKKKKVGEGLT